MNENEHTMIILVIILVSRHHLRAISALEWLLSRVKALVNLPITSQAKLLYSKGLLLKLVKLSHDS